MLKVKWSEFKKWHERTQQPQDYKFATHISTFFNSYNTLPLSLKNYDWTETFSHPVVVYYDERITVQTLETLQDFFRQTACDIENIYLVTSHAGGLADWWHLRCKLHLEKTFQIQEWLLCRTMTWPRWMSELHVPSKDKIVKEKRNQYFFSFWGGTNPKIDRLFITLKMCALQHWGIVDCLTDVKYTKQDFVNHAMWLGYFQNVQEEHMIGQLYDQYVSNGKILSSSNFPQFNQSTKGNPNVFRYQGYHWHIDSLCLTTICNETDNMQPWAMISEKTLIPFLHYNFVIPIAYRSVDILESKGFWFDHDIIDYSYQWEPDWLSRLNKMISSIQRSAQLLDNSYFDYFLSRFDRLHENMIRIYDHLNSDCD